MWFVDLILRAIVSTLIILGGIQDWKCGEVSNWITIPLLVAGLVACVIRLFKNPDTGLSLTALVLLLTLLAWNGWMGGADWKVLVGLFGLWPVAGFAAILTAGLWGLVEMVRKRDRNVRFPGIAAYAAATGLTFLIELFTMSPINKV
jgi:Flp pilus assembly protein protease CpaA